MVAVFFDLGRNLGVLRAPLKEKAAIIHGVSLTTIKLRDTTDLGAFLRSADEPIREWIRGADEVHVEAPNTIGQNHWAIRKNCALLGHVFYWACHHGIPCKPWNVTEAKLALADRGNAKKEEMMAAAEFQLGLRAGTLTEHEADAYAGWLLVSYGAPPNAAQRQKAAVAKRKAAREAAKTSKLSADLDILMRQR